MFSNRYIFIYSTILVVIVAAILAIAAVLLKPFQDKNIETEKIQNLLQAAGVVSTPENAAELYKKYIVEEQAVDQDGKIVSVYKEGRLEGKIRPFEINLKEQQGLRKAGKGSVAPVYVFQKDSEKLFIVPMLGTGLWGPIWGNIALADDFNTVKGVSFDHKGETPGLGAEIVGAAFQERFLNKQLFEGDQFISVRVKKNADKSSLHEVDALSGGTITSEGVSNMLFQDLSFYKVYREQHIKDSKPQ